MSDRRLEQKKRKEQATVHFFFLQFFQKVRAKKPIQFEKFLSDRIDGANHPQPVGP